MSDEVHTWTDDDLARHTEILEKIRDAATEGDTLQAARLQLAHLEAGTPIVTAYVMLQIIIPLLPPGIAQLAQLRLADTGVRDAALSVATATRYA